MKPTIDEARFDIALKHLAEEMDVNETKLYEAVTNEAQVARNGEPPSELRIEDLSE